MSFDTGRWLLASNRLPFKYNAQSGEFDRSSGGLVTAIQGISTPRKVLWFGALPESSAIDLQPGQLGSDGRFEFSAISVQPELYSKYYDGFCNTVLWPLLHYEGNLVEYSRTVWESYIRVNQLFAESIAHALQPGDIVWLHDFHLFLVPMYLRELGVGNRTGLFLHTPFPSMEIFRQLPVREEILRGILAADLVGFHDYSYLRHFRNSVELILGHASEQLEFQHEGRLVRLGVFPVSIDTAGYSAAAESETVKQIERRERKRRNSRLLILGVDRLDYIKGLKLKLLAFRELLQNHPEMRGEVVLMQIIVPSRLNSPHFVQLKREIEQLVGEINGEYGRTNYTPVQYLFTSVPFEELLALYRMADALFVSSVRDGMNLVALEYLCAQPDNDPGVVVLSEFAGAMSALSHVLLINPWNTTDTAGVLFQALTMERTERVDRQKMMRSYLDRYHATKWAELFIERLVQELPSDNKEGSMIIHPHSPASQITNFLSQVQGKPVIVFLDYDGTLVSIKRNPMDAVLPESTHRVLERLCKEKEIVLVIVSGRDRRFLARQLGELPVVIGAEHGAFVYDHSSKKWVSLVRHRRESWMKVARDIVDDYCFRVPGSFMESKQYSLAWHYRQSPPEFAEQQARRLRQDLDAALARQPATVISGHRIVEVRAAEANKGVFADWYLDHAESLPENPALLAIGDDQTDEELFSAILRRGGLAVRVGLGKTVAPFRVNSVRDVLALLERVAARAQN